MRTNNNKTRTANEIYILKKYASVFKIKLQAAVCWPKPCFQPVYNFGSTKLSELRLLREGYAYD